MEPQNDSNAPAPGSVVQPPQSAAPAPAVDPALFNAVIEGVKPVVVSVASETAHSILADLERTKVGGDVVRFFDSAVGKSVQTLLWTLVAFLLAIIGIKIANVHFNAHLIALGLPGLINWILYSAKVFADGRVPNLPTKK